LASESNIYEQLISSDIEPNIKLYDEIDNFVNYFPIADNTDKTLIRSVRDQHQLNAITQEYNSKTADRKKAICKRYDDLKDSFRKEERSHRIKTISLIIDSLSEESKGVIKATTVDHPVIAAPAAVE